MTINTKLLTISALSTIAAGLLITSGAQAASTKTSPLADKIASTFHLNASDVQNVIASERQAHRSNRPARLKTTLDQMVSSGKITQDQENAILAEAKTLHQQFRQDKKTDRANLKSQLQQWLNQNGYNINLDSLSTPAAA